MPESLSTLLKYGYQSLFVLLFLEAVGFPVPGALVLLSAGAAAAIGSLDAVRVFSVAVIAMLAGDTLLYVVGRFTGWYFLGLLCRFSLNPETCILRSAESFYKRGKRALVFAKFIPGINTMAPPLAGSMNMKAPTFLTYDFFGAVLYIAAFWVPGFLFSELLKNIAQGIQTFGTVLEWLVVIAIVGYVVYRLQIAWRYKKLGVAPHVDVITVSKLLETDAGSIVVADVRSHGYYDSGTVRIKGSIRIEPNGLAETYHKLPTDKKIFLYCT
jgi:membrane protein DedA with SNARE-associated domain